MADLGRIQPIYGRWYWPFRQMAVGDEFYVAFQDREPEAVRQMATVRAAQLGIRLRTNKDNEAGVMRIERIEFDLDGTEKLPKALSYEQLHALIRDEYREDIATMPWGGAIDPGRAAGRKAVRVGNDPRRLVEAVVADHRYAVELRDDEVIAHYLAPSETLQHWQEAQMIAIME